MQRVQLCAQHLQPFRRDAIGPPPLFGRKWLDPALLLETGDGSVQGSWTKTRVTKGSYVFNHGVPLFWTAGKAGQHQERRVRVMTQIFMCLAYFVARTTHNVVIARCSRRGKRNCLVPISALETEQFGAWSGARIIH